MSITGLPNVLNSFATSSNRDCIAERPLLQTWCCPGYSCSISPPSEFGLQQPHVLSGSPLAPSDMKQSDSYATKAYLGLPDFRQHIGTAVHDGCYPHQQCGQKYATHVSHRPNHLSDSCNRDRANASGSFPLEMSGTVAGKR